MGKMSDLDLIVKDLQSAAERILDAAKDIEAMFSSPASASTTTTASTTPTASTTTTAEAAGGTKETAVSIDEVRTVLAALSNDGKKSAVKKLLANYGSSRLSEIDPKNYKALLKDAEEVRNAG